MDNQQWNIGKELGECENQRLSNSFQYRPSFPSYVTEQFWRFSACLKRDPLLEKKSSL